MDGVDSSGTSAPWSSSPKPPQAPTGLSHFLLHSINTLLTPHHTTPFITKLTIKHNLSIHCLWHFVQHIMGNTYLLLLFCCTLAALFFTLHARSDPFFDKRIANPPQVEPTAEAPEIEQLEGQRSTDKSMAGGGVIIGGLVTAIFAAVYCYIRVTRKRATEQLLK